LQGCSIDTCARGRFRAPRGSLIAVALSAAVGAKTAVDPQIDALKRNFTATEPNKAWVTDITYLPTRQGWLYVAVILDLFSRRIVGWATSQNIDCHLALAALDMAVTVRRCIGAPAGPGE